jgi:REP element-mobilizing transposase RayT
MRRRPTQLELSSLVPAGWGGARRNAGRPPISGRRPPVPHRLRAEHHPRFPVHVTLRAGASVPSLRSMRFFPAILTAIRRSSNGRFRVCAFSAQSDHIHAIVEADGGSLVGGNRGLAIRVALAVNRALTRTGAVWSDRYHARQLRTPHEVRATLLYVLQNWKKHLRGASGIDGCSSGPWFDGWVDPVRRPPTFIPVAQPRTWLGSRGWRERGGGPLRVDEAPASGPPPARRTVSSGRS